MELIKKIKQAETQAQEIIAQAGTDAASQAEQYRMNRLEADKQAQQERKAAIEAALGQAQTQAHAESQNLKAQAEDRIRQLWEKTESRKTAAVEKVMQHLKG
jgi:V/A-type H+-transporting ATPase subunit G/H